MSYKWWLAIAGGLFCIGIILGVVVLFGLRTTVIDAFLKEVKKCESPYGDGKAAPSIADILRQVEITPQLLQKKITY